MKSQRSIIHRIVLAVLALAFLSAAAPARADDEDKRAPQDYGRPHDTTAGDVALWIPRVALFPFYLISQYMLRAPIGLVVRTAEKDDWAGQIYDFFTFGARKQLGIFPSFLVDFGLLPSVGVNGFYKYAGAENNTIDFHLGFWGPNWLNVIVSDRYDWTHRDHLTLRGQFIRRQDNPFYGLGPKSEHDDRARYGTDVIDARLGYDRDLGSYSTFGTSAGATALAFHKGSCCDDLSVRSAVDRGRFAPPTGYGEDYVAFTPKAQLVLDSRAPRPNPGTGVHFEAHAEPGIAPAMGMADPKAWLRYSGSLGGVIDLTGKQRNLGIAVDTVVADSITGHVPFTEQATLGGDVLMRGYLRGRLVGRSALVGTLSYTWPVWALFDGSLQVATGNVFGTHYDGFNAKLLRMSYGIGVRGNAARGANVEVLIALGTKTIDEGAGFDTVRFVFGVHHGI